MWPLLLGVTWSANAIGGGPVSGEVERGGGGGEEGGGTSEMSVESMTGVVELVSVVE